MKYSLRSLMTFSIRDLFWLTVVVAMAVAWWADRSKLADEVKQYETIQMPPMIMPGMSGTLKEYRQKVKEFEDEWNKKTEAQKSQEAKERYEWEHRWEKKTVWIAQFVGTRHKAA